MGKLDELKRHVFFEFLNLAGRAYIIVRYSQNVIFGNRGFVKEEKENGIILVFNSKMNFVWDDDGIKATLIFGTSPLKCYIPAKDIILIYSPELNAQFAAQLSAVIEKKDEDKTEEPEIRSGFEREQKKVIKVDFTKKRKKDE